MGSTGRVKLTASGAIKDNSRQWVKVISPLGEVHSLNWSSNYRSLAKALDIEFPGIYSHVPV